MSLSVPLVNKAGAHPGEVGKQAVSPVQTAAIAKQSPLACVTTQGAIGFLLCLAERFFWCHLAG